MPSASEFPFGLLLSGAFFVVPLAFTVDQFADLAGVGALEATAVLVLVPLSLALVVAVAVRDRLPTRRRRVQFVAAGTVLAAMLEVAAVGVVARGVDRWDLLAVVAVVVTGYAMQRFDLPTGIR